MPPEPAIPPVALTPFQLRVARMFFVLPASKNFYSQGVLAQRYTKDLLLTRASEIEPGFDTGIFREMLKQLSRFADKEIPVNESELPALRVFFAAWIAELG